MDVSDLHSQPEGRDCHHGGDLFPATHAFAAMFLFLEEMHRSGRAEDVPSFLLQLAALSSDAEGASDLWVRWMQALRLARGLTESERFSACPAMQSCAIAGQMKEFQDA